MSMTKSRYPPNTSCNSLGTGLVNEGFNWWEDAKHVWIVEVVLCGGAVPIADHQVLVASLTQLWMNLN